MSIQTFNEVDIILNFFPIRHLENDVCPSTITLRINRNGTCDMKYYKKHFGHECTSFHVKLSNDIKENVASLLSNKVDENHIIRSSKDAFDLKDQFLDFIKQFDTFNTYFTNYYSTNYELWAYCFRKNLKINTNMAVESYHHF